MRDEITITRKGFYNKINEIIIKTKPESMVKTTLNLFANLIAIDLFDKPDEAYTENEVPFEVGDTVFVIDNERDGNHFVNQVAKVKSVDSETCYVYNKENYTQNIYFKNLRKVETP